MPILYEIQKRTSSFAQGKKTKYYPIAKRWDQIGRRELLEKMVENKSLTRQEAESALDYLLEAIPFFLRMGHSIDLGDLGRMFITIRSTGSDLEEEASWRNVKKICINFVPGKKLQAEINNIPLEKFPEK